MKCYEIMECLEEVSPKSFAESWDNVGLLCGRERGICHLYCTGCDKGSDRGGEGSGGGYAAHASSYDFSSVEAGCRESFYRRQDTHTGGKQDVLLCHAHQF